MKKIPMNNAQPQPLLQSDLQQVARQKVLALRGKVQLKDDWHKLRALEKPTLDPAK